MPRCHDAAMTRRPGREGTALRDDARGHSSVRRTRRVACAIVVGSAILAMSVIAVRPDLRRGLTYQLQSHSGTPPATALAPFARTDLPSVRLAAAGDVGTGDSEAWKTAMAMDEVEADDEYDALLLLGDNVYPDGAPSDLGRVVFDPFEGVLDGGTRLLAVLGNHDIRNGNAGLQADVLGMSNRWYSTEIGNAIVLSLDSNCPEDPDQLAWLESTLEATSATWKIAMLHHPPYSGGYHGSDLRVRDAFAPLFERYGVELVLSGHDHDYQRSEPVNGVVYVVSGGAATLRPAHRAKFTETAWSTYHFVDIAVWDDRLELRAVDQTGAMFDSIVIHAGE